MEIAGYKFHGDRESLITPASTCTCNSLWLDQYQRGHYTHTCI